MLVSPPIKVYRSIGWLKNVIQMVRKNLARNALMPDKNVESKTVQKKPQGLGPRGGLTPWAEKVS